jgi:hypothetical protein
MQIKDGWFEEQEDGTRDYIALLESGEVVRCKNAYLTGLKYEGLDCGEEEIVVKLSKRYNAP